MLQDGTKYEMLADIKNKKIDYTNKKITFFKEAIFTNTSFRVFE